VAEFPEYSLSVKETEVSSDSGLSPVQVHLLVECGLSKNTSTSIKPKKQTRRMTVVLTLTSDMDLIDFRRIPSVIFLHSRVVLIFMSRTEALTNGKLFEVIAELTKPSQTVIMVITSVGQSLYNFIIYSL
jgi:ATP-dependent DNA helicase HFM1/MER3